MTSPLVKIVLTLALGVCSLQGISCLDDRVKKLGKCLAKTKTKLMKAEQTISQFTTKSCQLSAQHTTQFNEILTHIKKTDETLGTQMRELATNNGELVTQNKQHVTQIEKLENQNEKLVNQIEKLENQNEQHVTQIEKLENQNEKLVTINEKLENQNEKLMNQLSKKGNTGKLLTSIASRITNTEQAIDDIHNVVIPTTCTDVNSPNPRPIVTLPAGPTVVCDTTTGNGGWVVFQRRTSGDVDFYRNWQQYKDGFGDKPNNFWLGLEAIHQLTSGADHELRVDMKFKGKNYYAHYKTFRVLGEEYRYKLEISDYSGDAGDSLAEHNGHYFSTKDRDHDTSSRLNCAQDRHGAWWYSNCYECNLNGRWGSTEYLKGNAWMQTTGHRNSVSFSEMKFRRRRP